MSADPDTPLGTPAARSRRSLVLGVAGAGLGLAGAGILVALDAGGSARPSPYSGDLRRVALAAALENQAVGAYQALGAALRAGRLGAPAPAPAAFLETATRHHTQHAATWNAILRDARRPPVTGVPLTSHQRLAARIAAASSLDDVLAVVRELENRAAATHAATAGSVRGNGPVVLAAAAIAPVEAMHAASLAAALGRPSALTGFLGAAEAVALTELTA